MEIQWFAHARERLHERRVEESLVLQTIRDPEQIVRRGHEVVFQRRYRDAVRGKTYLLRVFAKIQQRVIVVRSLYRTSKIDKYWREACR